MRILGIRVDLLTKKEALQKITDWIKRRDRLYQIATINPEFVMAAQGNDEFREALENSDLNLIDGVGILWAVNKIQNSKRRDQRSLLPFDGIKNQKFERFTGLDLVEELCKIAAQNSWRGYFLGAGPGVAEKALECQKKKYPGLEGKASDGIKIQKGFMSFWGRSEATDSRIDSGQARTTEQLNKKAGFWINKIKDFNPQILFVAFGAPKQDIFISKYKEQLPKGIAVGVGGVFDELAGVVPQVPKWLADHNLKWFGRLLFQPWRIKRQIRLLGFVVKVLKSSERGYLTNCCTPKQKK